VCVFQTMRKLVPIPVIIVMMVTDVNASPWRVWGDVSSIYRTRDFDAGESTASNWLNIATINASSYIWRPWFAIIDGGLNLSVDESDFSEQESVKNKYATGRFRFNLFPTSRYPFELYFNQSRNELDDNLLDRDITTSEYGIGQQYRSQDGRHHYRADYKNNTRENGIFDRLEGQRLFFSGNNQFSDHTIATDFQFDTIDDKLLDEQADSFTVTGRHSYDIKNNFSSESLLSTSRVENDFSQSISNVRTTEISSFLSWHPNNRNDINLTASFRLSDLLFRQEDNAFTPIDESLETDNATTNINQGLLYQYSDNLLFRETINANYTESQNQTLFIATESIGLSYIPDRKITSMGDYGWSVTPSINNQHGDTESLQSLDTQFSHSLANKFSIQGRHQIRTNLTQSLGYDFQSSRVDKKSMVHSFSISWTEPMINKQSMVRFLISDSRSQEEEERLFQLVNLQYSGAIRFNRYSRLVGNITLQRTNQEYGDDRSKTTVTNGQLDFTRDRVFQVPRLFFRSKLELGRQQSESERFLSELNESSETDNSLENSLNYRIGRLEVRANIDFIKVSNEYNRLFKIQLTRSFGDL